MSGDATCSSIDPLYAEAMAVLGLTNQTSSLTFSPDADAAYSAVALGHSVFMVWETGAGVLVWVGVREKVRERWSRRFYGEREGRTHNTYAMVREGHTL